METTLEVRWFYPGMPPAVVQRWFELDLLGELLPTETRTDWYADLKQYDSVWLNNFSSRVLDSEEVNFKLRQGNLELKLRERLSNYKFERSNNSSISAGKVEQWCKYDSQQLKESIPIDWLRDRRWVGVDKERSQKLDGGVAVELTRLKVNRECWWTVAFEMPQGDRPRQDNYFQQIVQQACQKYRGPKLSTINSYGYSCWLLGLTPKIVSEYKLNLNSRHHLEN